MQLDHRAFGREIAAGLLLSVIAVPAGLGYAQASGLDPVRGLYASIAAFAVYALVGPSRVLVIGPDSSLVPLVAAATAPLLAEGDSARASVLAASIAVAAGVFCVASAAARFGFVSELLSLPVRHGYINGIALIVAVGQLARLAGTPTDSEHVFGKTADFARSVARGEIQGLTFTVGASALAIIVILRMWLPRFPAMLVAVAAAVCAAAALDLARRGVAMVGALPQGVPLPALPSIRRDDFTTIAATGFGIATVAFADTSLLAKTVSDAERREVRANRELLALGLCNVASGLLRGFPVSASATRTSVAISARARTRLAGAIAALAIGAVLIAAPQLFRYLPESALAAVVIAAAVSLIEFRPLLRLARQRPSEVVPALIALTAVIVIGPVQGVLIAVAVSLLTFIAKAWRPYSTELVRVPGLKGYHDANRHPEGETVPGLVLYRFGAPLFFANATAFSSELLRIAERPGIRRIVVTAEPITDVDATAAAMLGELVSSLEQRGITLGFAELKGLVRDRLARYGLVERVGVGHFYRTVGEAVHSYVAEERVEWTDWEDR